MTDDQLIDEITAIRARNNKCWMGLLRLAVKHASADAKLLLLEIQDNDLEISRLNGRLAK